MLLMAIPEEHTMEACNATECFRPSAPPAVTTQTKIGLRNKDSTEEQN